MKRLILLLCAVFTAIPFSSRHCGAAEKANSIDQDIPQSNSAKGVSYVRILHAIAGAPAADVYFDGKKVASNLAFKAISDYLPVASGKTAIKITAAGKDATILDGTTTFTRDAYYTLAPYGTMDKAKLTSQNDNTGKADAAKARIRAFHLAPGAPNLEINFAKVAVDNAESIKKLEYGEDVTKLIEAGATVLQVRAGTRIVSEGPISMLEGGHKYAVFIVGKLGIAGAQAFEVLLKPAGP